MENGELAPKKSRFRLIFGGNRGIWIILAFLFMYSVLSVYSGSVQLPGDNTTGHLFKHVGGLLLGVVCIYLIHKIPCKFFRFTSFLLYALSIVLLIVTWAFAPEVNGAKRWLYIGPLTVQTSDIAKVALLMFLAHILSKKETSINDIGSFVKSILLPISLTCFLIMPSNLSTAVLVFIEAMVLLAFSNIKKSYFWGLLITAVVGAGLFLALILYTNIDIWRFPTWRARVESWIEGNPNKDDQVQVNNAKMAVASGGVLGRGPGNGHAKVKLANVHCDYIFANIVEEVGLIGGMFLMWLYIMLFYRAISIVKKINKLSKTPDNLEPKYKFRQYLVLGLTAMIVLQALSNMAVSTDIIPVTGQTMPFVSYGTSSLLFMGVAMGIILSVSREVENDTNVADKMLETQTKEAVAATADGNTEIVVGNGDAEVIIDDEDNGGVSGRDVLEMINDNELNIEENERE